MAVGVKSLYHPRRRRILSLGAPSGLHQLVGYESVVGRRLLVRSLRVPHGDCSYHRRYHMLRVYSWDATICGDSSKYYLAFLNKKKARPIK